MSAEVKPRAHWRLYDYTGKIRAEVRDTEAKHAAVAFRALINSAFGPGSGVPHPSISVRRVGQRTWTRLSADAQRRFWSKAHA